jgi:hypothetical protein
VLEVETIVASPPDLLFRMEASRLDIQSTTRGVKEAGLEDAGVVGIRVGVRATRRVRRIAIARMIAVRTTMISSTDWIWVMMICP